MGQATNCSVSPNTPTFTFAANASGKEKCLVVHRRLRGLLCSYLAGHCRGRRGWTLDRDGAVFFVKAASPPADFVVDRYDPPSVRTGERISYKLHPPNERSVQLLEKYECYMASRYVNQAWPVASDRRCTHLLPRAANYPPAAVSQKFPLFTVFLWNKEKKQKSEDEPIGSHPISRTCRRLVHKLRRLSKMVLHCAR